MHRLLPPSAIAGVSLVCALAPWVFTDAIVLRSLAAVAAATAVLGAAVMRRWDVQAGRQVADLTRARASDEWRFEERVAELETDLEESRELRVRLEQKLRARRAELAGLRNEHAALLRRYATAETERASALEGRRLLEIEAGPDTLALPAAPTADTAEAATEEKPEAEVPGVFSPEGSKLFLRAQAALSRLGTDGEEANEAVVKESDAPSEYDDGADAGIAGEDGPEEDGPEGDGPEGQPEAADAHEHAAATTTEATEPTAASDSVEPVKSVEQVEPVKSAKQVEPVEPAEPAPSARSAPRLPSGHFTVPTAVAVVPAAPARRPVAEGGFDFFGTKKDTPSTDLDTVQNEDLADVVGQEALTLHKAEAESQYKPAAGQVIDLTAHDETEPIDMQGLRTAAS
ncbi:hypothetical protein C1I97_02190 [Streptomyces sp. NTH33]|uniref:hypothetical protein n=1 Tax=Streptomyces sp. NTH33 TaxID=1735453 RepID=UPI000DA76BB7|nr:hypothetical protein [Streptomyces sp. NTH33]PZH19654.1 hypothetical protein C1I97_02190 [Streptomyces sp. NTH33]